MYTARVGELMLKDNDMMEARIFTAAELERIRRHISGAREKAMYFYDLRLVEHSWLALWVPEELNTITLTSRNLGYDFELQKVVQQTEARPSFAMRIDIYVSPCGERNYAFHKMATNVAEALKEVDSIYNKAAEYHLP